MSSVPDLDKIGKDTPHRIVYRLREEVAELLSRRSTTFPGSQPVSFGRRHIAELMSRDYFVCEKTDGIRCLMYFALGNEMEGEDEEMHYLIDRKNDYRFVPQLHFPVPGDESFRKPNTRTLLDGELVRDTYPDGSSQLKYLVFDCLVLSGASMLHRTLDKRLGYFKQNVLAPYNAMHARFPEKKRSRPFVLEDKSTQVSYGVEMMFREIIPKVKKMHGNDGLIFTCRTTPYVSGTDQNLLKWKPPEENTVDYRLRLEFPPLNSDHDDDGGAPNDPGQFLDYDAMPAFHLFVVMNSTVYKHYGYAYVTEREWENLKAEKRPLDDTIVECYLDEEKRWRLTRFRTDKADANHISTVESVLDSIQDRVDEDDLIRAAPAIKIAWKQRHAEEAREEMERKRVSEARKRPNNDWPSADASGGVAKKRSLDRS